MIHTLTSTDIMYTSTHVLSYTSIISNNWLGYYHTRWASISLLILLISSLWHSTCLYPIWALIMLRMPILRIRVRVLSLPRRLCLIAGIGLPNVHNLPIIAAVSPIKDIGTCAASYAAASI